MLVSGVLSISRAAKTSVKKVASDAAKALRDPKATKKEKELAGSDLAQAKHKSKKANTGVMIRSDALEVVDGHVSFSR